jgi:hypothetical protein
MRRRTWCGAGAVLTLALWGCSGDDPAPGSEVGQPKGGDGGSGGGAGTLNLIAGAGSGGAAGGGAGGGGGGGAGNTTGGAQAGTSAGGVMSQAGTTSGGSGTGGSKPAGMCKRATTGDADCKDFYEDKPQAYACDDINAAAALNRMHDGSCASVSFVPGAKYGSCCPP